MWFFLSYLFVIVLSHFYFRDVGGDLIGSIMFEQTKTLAPARFQKVARDGKILETELMVEHRKKVEKKISGNQAFAAPKVSNC